MCVCVLLLWISWIFPHWSHIEQPECFWTESFKLILFYSILHCFTQLCSEMSCVLIWRVTSLVPYHLVWKNKLQSHLWSSQMFWGFLGRIPCNRLNALMGRAPAFILSLRATYTQRSGLEGRGPRSVSRRTGAWWHQVTVGQAQGFLRIWMDWMDVNYVFHVKRVELLYKYVSASTGWKCLAGRMTHRHTHTPRKGTSHDTHNSVSKNEIAVPGEDAVACEQHVLPDGTA